MIEKHLQSNSTAARVCRSEFQPRLESLVRCPIRVEPAQIFVTGLYDVACRNYFDTKGITYTAIDITEDTAAYDYVTKELGYSQAPVVRNTETGEHWSGLRRDKLVQATMNRTALAAAS